MPRCADRRAREDSPRLADLDQHAVRVGVDVLGRLDAEERRAIGHARRLLHVVRHDHDRVVALELVDELLDAPARDRVERRGRLVHQQHLGLDGQAARDAEALLLAAREPPRVAAEPILDLVPERGLPQRALDALVEVALEADRARAEGDVVADRARERIGLLEDHADAPPHLDRIDAGRVEVGAEEANRALDARPGHEVVHAVERAQDRRLAAARRPDEGRHRPLLARRARRRAPPHAVVAHRQSLHLEHGERAAAAPSCSGRTCSVRSGTSLTAGSIATSAARARTRGR